MVLKITKQYENNALRLGFVKNWIPSCLEAKARNPYSEQRTGNWYTHMKIYHEKYIDKTTILQEIYQQLL